MTWLTCWLKGAPLSSPSRVHRHDEVSPDDRTFILARVLILCNLGMQTWTWTGRSWTWSQDAATFVCTPCCSCDWTWFSITLMVVPKALDLRLSSFICWHHAWTRSSCFGEPRWKRTFADKELGEPFPLIWNRASKGTWGRWHEERDGIHG